MAWGKSVQLSEGFAAAYSKERAGDDNPAHFRHNGAYMGYRTSPRGDAGCAGCLSRLSDVTDATGGVRTLREAVVLSNEAIGSDSIQFSSGLAAIIQLRQSPLTIRDTLTIVGPGSSQIGINDLRVTGAPRQIEICGSIQRCPQLTDSKGSTRACEGFPGLTLARHSVLLPNC